MINRTEEELKIGMRELNNDKIVNQSRLHTQHKKAIEDNEKLKLKVFQLTKEIETV